MSFRGWQKVTINIPTGTVEGIAPVIVSASRAINKKSIKNLDKKCPFAIKLSNKRRR